MTYAALLSRFRSAALAECVACDGRARGDCSDQCRYFVLTATAQEREAAAFAEAEFAPRTVRGWVGARGVDKEDAA